MSPHWLPRRPTPEQIDALRGTLATAWGYRSYRDCFAAAGIGAVADADPLATLAALPPFDPPAVNRLASEALALRAFDLGGVEVTSGTTGAPKRRVFSEEDVRLDAVRVTRLLRLAGVRAEDRAAAMDLHADPLALAFLEGCERLGVRDAVGLALTARLDGAPLLRYDPTVLIAPPNLLTRLAGALTGARRPPSLRLVIYNGGLLAAHTARAFRAAGVGVRSLYGLTEAAALGVSCAAEQGVHLATEHALAELRPVGRDRELLVTTLGYSMPLLRYPTGDRVRVARGRCPCGSPWPRVELLGRVDDRFSLYDVKVTPEEVQALLLEGPEEWLEIVLDTTAAGAERMTLRLPAALHPRRANMLAQLRRHPLLAYLIQSRLLRVRFRFRDPPPGRKLRPVRDHRARPDGATE